MTRGFKDRVAVVIPVLNGGEIWREAARALHEQRPRPDTVLVIDSGSTDGSERLAERYGFDLLQIDKADFDHGGTRQMAVEHLRDHDRIVFVTQDAVMASTDAIAKLVAAFDDPAVGVAYGRQLPRQGATPIEAHARLFNYPAHSDVRTLADVSRLGIKAAFTSNSFAAYRFRALSAVGGFPARLILSEDMVATARILLRDWSVAYVAEACAFHSHGYRILEEFRRYFDIGVLHQDQSWLLERFGKPEGEGGRYVLSEFNYLRKRAPWLLPSAFIRTLAKYLGYKLGQKSASLPASIKPKLSMNSRFWEKSG